MRDPLAHRAAASPDRVAVIAPSGDAPTYAELDACVEDTAERLATLGLTAGDHLGLLLEARPAFPTLVHAAWRLGCRVVPLNSRLEEAAVAGQVEQAAVDAIICDSATTATATAMDVGHVASVDVTGAVGSTRDLGSRSFERSTWDVADPALLMFTSGTTGDPKAVTLTLGNLLASAAASATRLGVLPDDRWLSPLPPFHMGGFAPIVRSACYGTAVVIPGSTDPGTLVDGCHRHGVTGISIVPTLLDRLLETDRGLPESLRFVLLGGGRIPTALLERAMDRGVPVYPTYGLTETASQVATATPDQVATDLGTVGRPLLFTEVTVVDDDGEPVDPGIEGEIVVEGPTVTPGYYDDGAATDAAFGPRGFHTGDQGVLDDAGRLTVGGRRTDRIVTGGENVDPGAVADALRSHPDVADAAVVGISDPEWGERVAALVVSAPGPAPDAAGIERHCRDHLAAFERPRTIAFADELPRTPSGTVDRDRVRRLLRERD